MLWICPLLIVGPTVAQQFGRRAAQLSDHTPTDYSIHGLEGLQILGNTLLRARGTVEATTTTTTATTTQGVLREISVATTLLGNSLSSIGGYVNLGSNAVSSMGIQRFHRFTLLREAKAWYPRATWHRR